MAEKRLTLDEMSDGLAWIASTAERLRGQDGRAIVILSEFEVWLIRKAADAMAVLDAYGAGGYVRNQMLARRTRENAVRETRKQPPVREAPGQNTYADAEDVEVIE